MLLGLCRLVALVLLPVLAKPQCQCKTTYRSYQLDVQVNDECYVEYVHTSVYYCGQYEYGYYNYYGYFCKEF